MWWGTLGLGFATEPQGSQGPGESWLEFLAELSEHGEEGVLVDGLLEARALPRHGEGQALEPAFDGPLAPLHFVAHLRPQVRELDEAVEQLNAQLGRARPQLLRDLIPDAVDVGVGAVLELVQQHLDLLHGLELAEVPEMPVLAPLDDGQEQGEHPCLSVAVQRDAPAAQLVDLLLQLIDRQRLGGRVGIDDVRPPSPHDDLDVVGVRVAPELLGELVAAVAEGGGEGREAQDDHLYLFGG